MNKLAIVGGQPLIPNEFRRFPHPTIDDLSVSAVTSQMKEDISIYDNGGVYRKLESAFKSWHGVSQCLSVNSGTSALATMYFSANLSPGSEILTPCYTFFATATPMLLFGLRPVLVDCDANGNIDIEDARRRLTSKTRAIVMTHMWGIPCDISSIQSFATEHGLLTFEDASHAHGAKHQGKMVGTTSDAAAWSLQGKKNLSAGEGGIYATGNSEFYDRAVLLGHFNKRAIREVQDPLLKAFSITGGGLNLRMHPFGAALALEQLERQPKMLAEKREVANWVSVNLSGVKGLSMPAIRSGDEPAWYAYPLVYNARELGGVSKSKFVAACVSEGAEEMDIPNSTCPLTRFPLFSDPASLHSMLSQWKPTVPEIFPMATQFHDKIIKLPVWYGPRRFEYARWYVDAIKKVVQSASSIT